MLKQCKKCQKEFETQRAQAVFCSNRCARLKHLPKICPQCNQTFHPIRLEQIYCSRECRLIHDASLGGKIIAMARSGCRELEICKTLQISSSYASMALSRAGIENPASRWNTLLSNQQRSLIIGSLLGDANGSVIKSGKAYVRFGHGPKQYDYIDWKYEIMKNVVGSPPKTIRCPKAFGSEARRFQTLTNSEITAIVKLIYINNTKQITLDYLNKVDDFAFATWFMDDGCNSKSWGSISTHSFTIDENRLIAAWLSNRFQCPEPRLSLDKRCSKYSIKLNVEILRKIRSTIKPYVPSCMSYKAKEW